MLEYSYRSNKIQIGIQFKVFILATKRKHFSQRVCSRFTSLKLNNISRQRGRMRDFFKCPFCSEGILFSGKKCSTCTRNSCKNHHEHGLCSACSFAEAMINADWEAWRALPISALLWFARIRELSNEIIGIADKDDVIRKLSGRTTVDMMRSYLSKNGTKVKLPEPEIFEEWCTRIIVHGSRNSQGNTDIRSPNVPTSSSPREQEVEDTDPYRREEHLINDILPSIEEISSDPTQIEDFPVKWLKLIAVRENINEIERGEMINAIIAKSRRVKPLPRDEEAQNLIEQCCVCLTNKRAVALDPCGHFVMCFGCSDNVKKCPTCTSKIDKKIRIFM
jgi:hypothetical protein